MGDYTPCFVPLFLFFLSVPPPNCATFGGFLCFVDHDEKPELFINLSYREKLEGKGERDRETSLTFHGRFSAGMEFPRVALVSVIKCSRRKDRNRACTRARRTKGELRLLLRASIGNSRASAGRCIKHVKKNRKIKGRGAQKRRDAEKGV